MPLDFTIVDGIVGEFHDRGHAPGVLVAVVADGEAVYVTGRGTTDRVTGAPTRGDGVYRIASMSKSFTAAAILQLRDRGLLHLDDPVALHLPGAKGLAGLTTDSPHVTLRHCHDDE